MLVLKILFIYLLTSQIIVLLGDGDDRLNML